MSEPSVVSPILGGTTSLAQEAKRGPGDSGVAPARSEFRVFEAACAARAENRFRLW